LYKRLNNSKEDICKYILEKYGIRGELWKKGIYFLYL
jgi:hypothetical protein